MVLLLGLKRGACETGMPMRRELVAPVIKQEPMTFTPDLLAVVVFCIIGLTLSFVFLAPSGTAAQTASLVSAIPLGR